MNRVQGDSLKEVAQEVRKEIEEESMGMEIRCPNQMQTDPDPLGVTPGPTKGPSSKPAGEIQEMECS